MRAHKLLYRHQVRRRDGVGIIIFCGSRAAAERRNGTGRDRDHEDAERDAAHARRGRARVTWLRQLLPLTLSANTIALMWLVGDRRTVGWVLGLVGQVGWFAFIVVFEAWGLLPLTVALTIVYARNLRRWRRSERAEETRER